jgi:transposase-like protein
MSTRVEIRERWRRILEDQRASGESMAAFCRRAGVRCAGFYKWRRKLGGRGGFAEVRIQPSPAISSKPAQAGEAVPLELRLAGGYSILVGRGFDRQVLRELLDTLEAAEPMAVRGGGSR